ncbi:MAG TPA: tetratricopeptide repeat protein [Opitutaceae bacterium]|nr:tetratricopeptide repeat protein [Opitutaceae bacterium]
MITKRNPIFRPFAWVGLATALALATPFARAQDDQKQQHQVSEKVSDALQKLKPLEDAKNFTGMLSLIDGLLPQVKADSYDAAYLLNIEARLYISLEKYPMAIDPWEKALALSDRYHYFDDATSQDIRKFTAQLLFQQATTTKNKAEQRAEVTKSQEYLKQYLARTKKPEPDTQMLLAQILYYTATADEKHIDQHALTEARKVIEQSMDSAIHPREGLYMLLIAIMQQQNDYAHSAQLSEVFLKQWPTRKDIWPTLFATYYNLAGSAKQDSDEQRQYYLRAINTIDRAQKLGYMNTPRDNYNLFTLYVAAGFPSVACDMLYDGMKKGKIESTLNNWRTLGLYYEQVDRDLDAINALKDATKLFPNEGNLDLLIGQIYQQDDDTKNAHDYYARAVKKGNLGEKPHLAYMYLAYTALELGDYDGALKAINEAVKTPDGAKDPQVKSVREGIVQTIADRNARLEAEKKKKK